MVNWALYQGIFDGIITPLLMALQGLIGGVVDAVRPAALALIMLWLAIAGIEVSAGQKTVQAVIKDILLAVFFLGLLQSSAVYMQYAGNLFLTVIPNSVATALGGQQSPLAGIDRVLDTALGEAIRTYQALPWSLAAIPLGIGIVIFVIVVFVATGFTFGVYTIAVFTVVVCVFVGPIFVGLAAVPATRKFSIGWLSVIVGGVTTQIMALAVLLLLTVAEGVALGRIGAQVEAGNNSINMLIGLGQCGILMFLCTIVIKEIPGFARAIGGGVHHNVSAIGGATFGAAASAGGAALKAAQGAAGAVGAHAGRQVGAGAVRATAPVGRSLSRG